MEMSNEMSNYIAFIYSKNLLDFILKIGLITKEEHEKITAISAKYYNIKNICLN